MAQNGLLSGRRVLVVEDDFLIAEALCASLEFAGAVVVGPLGSVSDAIRLLRQDDPAIDIAVLDVDLHGEKSYAVADVLAERGVPFLFTTGYNVDAVDVAYRDYPRCEKPLSERALFAALQPMTG
ncbi:response regulator [Lichenicoccus roseus]|uniref:response regulator n=1 Tax=Lichenicoccus roseus TaxID=2683649 RepID=UPI00197CC33B|nr:response regulator [Lichenicoccus roseus]